MTKLVSPPDSAVEAQGIELARLAADIAVCDALGISSTADVAKVAGISTQELEAIAANPEKSAQLNELMVKATKSRGFLTDLALNATTLMVGKIGAAVYNGEADLDDLDRLLPKVHRVLEHSEQMELRRGMGSALPVFVFNFGVGVQASAVGEADVVDVDGTVSPALEVDTSSASSTPDFVEIIGTAVARKRGA